MPTNAELEERIESLLVENEDLIKQQRHIKEKYLRELALAQDNLQKAQQALESALLAKTSFLASMSHELRTPLNTVIGFCQYLLKDNSLSKEQHEKVYLMLNSGEHLLGMINNILEISKIEMGKIDLQIVNFDLYETLEDLSSSYQAKSYSKGINFETDFAANLPRFLFGDYNKLRQILLSLLSNALKLTSRGEISFRAWQGKALYPDASHLFFEVQYTGQEIAGKDVESIFGLFSQIQSGKEASLGLSISREFARLMRGELKLESQLGQGSSFLLNLHIGMAETSPEKPNLFLERVARVADKHDRFSQLEARLVSLPKNIQGSLREALFQFSLSSVELVCQDIAEYDISLAQEIVGLAKEFDFKTILNLLPQ
jgi:signal transduction histidine kinase